MNANLPAQWLMYVRVAVAASAAEAERQRAEVLDGPGGWEAQFLCHSGPDGAVVALISD